ncbi:hypothetical protein [Methanobrevibacter curvatus]|uniref:PepSY domain-containing protein n=1 Tax=Methanobrevibacter curvatus TaxID=49547 RepID=A0A166DV79_9EURY|nr:hypothetical protein [Methanobrevibacter curvatus]KZX15988.1 hypothetical protein MBCUR_01640 [Methanobrevibacter curvatus]
MKNVNIIISVIIVLSIAAGVTAYGVMSPSGDNIFSNLQMNPDSDDSGDTPATDTGSGNSSTETNGNGGSSRNSGSSGNGGSGSGIVTHDGMTNNKAKEIAQAHIEVEGASAGTPYWNSEYKEWIVPVIKNGKQIAAISVDPKTGQTGEV